MAGVLLVIPAWNESRNLPEVLGELDRERPGEPRVVVDDGSEDDTGDVARRHGVTVLRLPLHLGYGAAVQTGLKFAMRRGHDVAVTFDGDGQHDPADVAPLVEAVREGADLAIGSRFLASAAYRGGFGRRAGRAVFSALARVLTGLPLTDPTSGLKALGPEAQRLFALARFPDRFPDADALVLARRARLRIVERPARMRPSRNRHSMHGGLRGVSYGFNMLASLLVAALGREADLEG
ncbi:MAG TPA: glycosyltransferase family 2 protein [Vicinamibacteria bacterium]|nr:glycosyltransferase family 2 protein [Vicinamibacteria bacterium]